MRPTVKRKLSPESGCPPLLTTTRRSKKTKPILDSGPEEQPIDHNSSANRTQPPALLPLLDRARQLLATLSSNDSLDGDTEASQSDGIDTAPHSLPASTVSPAILDKLTASSVFSASDMLPSTVSCARPPNQLTGDWTSTVHPLRHVQRRPSKFRLPSVEFGIVTSSSRVCPSGDVRG